MEVQVRKATWLELFYDLVFVVAIAKAVHTFAVVDAKRRYMSDRDA